MATKIILLVQDIKVGTEIVQFAIEVGAAIIEYSDCDSPLAKPKKKKKRVIGQLYAVKAGAEFREGTTRWAGYEVVKKSKKKQRRVDWIRHLVDTGNFPESQATSIVAGLLKAHALVPA